GCLPNHIVAKGAIRSINARGPGINIVPIDYDPSTASVNQENRIKLMLSVAKEQLDKKIEEKASHNRARSVHSNLNASVAARTKLDNWEL
ncbi:MAG: hypothetical protein JJE21_08520, partial [Spirochaetaceae bacterium]|nr:hypothetical protein [Spirochaetaceae bacterium]